MKILIVAGEPGIGLATERIINAQAPNVKAEVVKAVEVPYTIKYEAPPLIAMPFTPNPRKRYNRNKFK